jgi:hypothetical protein
MRKFTLTVIFAILVMSLVLSSCSSGMSTPATTAATTPDGATLVQERCSRCHPLARIESTNRTADEWKTIVDMMITRGAQLTPDEETAVVAYLAATFGK